MPAKCSAGQHGRGAGQMSHGLMLEPEQPNDVDDACHESERPCTGPDPARQLRDHGAQSRTRRADDDGGVRNGSAHLSHPALENIFCKRLRFVGRKVFGYLLGWRQPRQRLVLAIARCTDASREAIQRDGDFLR